MTKSEIVTTGEGKPDSSQKAFRCSGLYITLYQYIANIKTSSRRKTNIAQPSSLLLIRSNGMNESIMPAWSSNMFGKIQKSIPKGNIKMYNHNLTTTIAIIDALK